MITILDGSLPENPKTFYPVYEHLKENPRNAKDIKYYPLSQMEIKQCIGCWNCWWKTPGLCTLVDDAEQVVESVINSDLIIFASPIVAGFTSSVLKRMQDRLIVLIHPYIQLIQGECHHRKRYDKYPDFALLLEKEPDTDDDDIEIITDIYKRIALNFHCTLKHTWFTDTVNLEDIFYDTCLS
jgi:hypothetical protein